MANSDQIIQLATTLTPLILGFVRSHHRETGEIPTVEQVNEHIARRADEVVADIERMKAEHL